MSQISIPQALQIAIEHHGAGRLPEAESIYRQVLAVEPRNPDALHLLGLISTAGGNYPVAIDLISRAIAIGPPNPAYFGNFGETLRLAGRNEEALDACRRAVALNPNFAGPYNSIGLILFQQGQVDQAIAAYRRALEIQPAFPEALSNLGDALAKTGQLQESIAHYQAAIRLNPNAPSAHNNLGIAYAKLGREAESLAEFQAAVRANPRDIDALLNLASHHADRRQNQQAFNAYQAVLAVDPNRAEAYSGLAATLKAAERPDGAIAAYEKALSLRPANAIDHGNLGLCYRDRGQPVEAVAELRKAVQYDPALSHAHSGLIVTLFLIPGTTRRQVQDEQRAWYDHFAAPLAGAVVPNTNDRNPDRKLRVGYVSPDLREHPVGRFMLPLLAAHDRAGFEVACYSSDAAPDIVSEQLRAQCDLWRNVKDLDDTQLAQQIRDDKIDVLVDLVMHTGNNRLLTFARKPAPVQVSYLAYAGGTGLPTMDYRITDSFIDPPGEGDDAPYERPWRLPDCFWCYAPGVATPQPNPLPALSAGHITFASLSHIAKFSPAALECWAELLKRIPASRLRLHIPPGWSQNRALGIFQKAGIDLNRLIFVKHLKIEEYFVSYHHVDISLDPFPYAGGTTTCDALWMGVPVVSMSGELPTSRSGLSLLSAIGMEELVARSPEEYLRIAVSLANDLPRLASLRQELRGRMQSSPLTNAPRFVGNLEGAFREMWRKWCSRSSGV